MQMNIEEKLSVNINIDIIHDFNAKLAEIRALNDSIAEFIKTISESNLYNESIRQNAQRMYLFNSMIEEKLKYISDSMPAV